MSSFKFIKAKKRKTLLTSKEHQKSIDFNKKDPKTKVEYHETLYSDQMESSSRLSQPLFLRDVPGIEKTVDTIDRSTKSSVNSDIDNKVDMILSKKPIVTKHRKPSNVIYVVSKPQPGQVKGDWAVRSHGKIFSHHRTKQAAIQKAREIAKKREATVMVQNTDGTFSEGFKPRK
jgi:uncharacterized protein DUF2188